MNVWPIWVAALAPVGTAINVAAATSNPSEKRLTSLPIPVSIRGQPSLVTGGLSSATSPAQYLALALN
jgi:hypothetical protein